MDLITQIGGPAGILATVIVYLHKERRAVEKSLLLLTQELATVQAKLSLVSQALTNCHGGEVCPVREYLGPKETHPSTPTTHYALPTKA